MAISPQSGALDIDFDRIFTHNCAGRLRVISNGGRQAAGQPARQAGSQPARQPASRAASQPSSRAASHQPASQPKTAEGDFGQF